MSKRLLARAIKIALFVGLAATLLGGYATLAQKEYRLRDLRVVRVGKTSIKISWSDVRTAFQFKVYYENLDTNERHVAGSTTKTSFKITGLHSNTSYAIKVTWNDGFDSGSGTIVARTKANPNARGSNETDLAESRATPPPITCPHLPPMIAVSGHTMLTQCRIVDQSAIGRADVIEHDFVAAVDIWSEVPSRVEICFQSEGWLIFLDAAYTPRMLMPLLSSVRNGMTCGLINRAGTVVLLRDPMQLAQPIVPADPVPAAPVATSAIPLDNCLVKLVETLFLRAAPDGEIIGLVWQNSEVPVFEINGHWYKVEFEGKTGYISRYFRKVLRGGCG